MKIEFKQSFEIDGIELKIKKKDKCEIAEVPAFFLFVPFFASLIKENKVKVLEVKEEELDEDDIPKKYQDVEPDSVIVSIIEEMLHEKEDEDEEDSDSDSSVNDSKPNEAGKSEDVKSEEPAQQEEVKAEVKEEVKSEEVKSEEVKEPSKEEIEFAELHEKAKRLNKVERKRYEELKTKLGIEG